MKVEFKKSFTKYLNKRFAQSATPEIQILKEACFYTLKAPSSFFRPQLSVLTSQFLGRNAQEIYPWAMAIEVLHAASLIQDDLPFMDNAKWRRKKKANHLIFKKDMALLAGSCLFVEAFYLLSDSLFHKKRRELLELLVDKAGFYGMMGGQALDIRCKKASPDLFLKMCQLKTGSLIEASIEGPALLWATKKELPALKKYGRALGQAYQVADDIIDNSSLFFSKEKKLQLLEQLTQESLKCLNPFKERAEPLRKLALKNQGKVLKLRRHLSKGS